MISKIIPACRIKRYDSSFEINTPSSFHVPSRNDQNKLRLHIASSALTLLEISSLMPFFTNAFLTNRSINQSLRVKSRGGWHACHARGGGGIKGVLPVVTSQDRVTGTPRWLRVTDAGHGELGPADRLSRDLWCIGHSLQGCTRCRARTYGPRRPARRQNRTWGFVKAPRGLHEAACIIGERLFTL